MSSPTGTVPDRRARTLSIVIPTNRPLADVQATLDSALADSEAIEVILVVDGPGAATNGLELDAFDAATPRLRVLRLTRRLGAVHARRIGMDVALGDIVWFLDDDVVPAAGAGLAHLAAHRAGDVDLVLGSMHTHLSASPGLPELLYEEAAAGAFAAYAADPSNILMNMWAGNHSVDRTAFAGFPALNSELTWTYHSDRADGLEARRRGLQAVCHLDIQAVHHYQRSLRAWRSDCRRQGAGRALIHQHYHDQVGDDVPGRWTVGFGPNARRLVVASQPPWAAAALTDLLALIIRLLTILRLNQPMLKVGRVLRSVEQQRGELAFRRNRARPGHHNVPSAAHGTVPSNFQPSNFQPSNFQPSDVTLLMVSRGNSARVRAILERWRPHVSQIVLVADESGEPALLDTVADLVDRPAVIEKAFPVELRLERAWTLCTGRFVFRCDDDEIPSEALLAELRSITLDASSNQAAIDMRWVWPTPTQWIADSPWDTAGIRLVRNQPGWVHFPLTLHVTERLPGPYRSFGGALYHLRTMSPLADREAHCTKYSSISRPHHDGTPAQGEYLPELHDPSLQAVPFWDVDDIALAVSMSAAPRPSLRPPPRAGQSEVVRLDGGTRMNGRPEATVAVASMPSCAPLGTLIRLEVVVRNATQSVLPGRPLEAPRVSLATRWCGINGTVAEGARIELGEPVGAGRAVRLVRYIEIPVSAGEWELEVDLVEDGVAWFGCGERRTMSITERLPSPVMPASNVTPPAVGNQTIWPTAGPRFWAFFSGVVTAASPTSILEFGGGRSTTFLADQACATGAPMVTFEHSPEWHARIVEQLTAMGLPGHMVHLAPLVPGEPGDWYHHGVVERVLDSRNFDMVLVDGPPGDARRNEMGRHIVANASKQARLVMVDDVNRTTNLTMFQDLVAQMNHPDTYYLTYGDTVMGLATTAWSEIITSTADLLGCKLSKSY